MQLLDKFLQVRLLIFDMDGVLTNGKLLLMPNNEWVREMDIKDGFALQLAVKSGFVVAVMTGSSCEPVKNRLSILGVDRFYDKVSSKAEKVKELMNEFSFQKEEVLFMGDDIPDLEAFVLAGVRTCPADAVVEVRTSADYISTKTGGNGCVRDVIEKVLRVQGKWVHTTDIQSI